MGMIMLFAETHKKKKRTSNHWCSRKVFRVDWKDYPLLKKNGATLFRREYSPIIRNFCNKFIFYPKK